MTAPAIWWAGARPRTLGAAIVPVLVGTAAAGGAVFLRVLGCLVVAVGFQVGVNYANDYFDGTRGVDTAERIGPMRITASGHARPRAVLTAALVSIAIAAATGAWIASVVDPRLLLVGAASAAATLLYSGGPRPYASIGLGEVFVFLFFGPVATAGTAYVQVEQIRTEAWWASVPVGLLAVAILVANNLRDIATDAASGKRTLAVRLGARGTRALYKTVVAVALVLPIVGYFAEVLPVGALLTLTAAPLAAGPWRSIRDADGPVLVRVLLNTAMLHAQFGAMLALGLWLS